MNLQQKLDELAPIINEIRNDAHALHASVNHAYDRIRPYGFHLDMVLPQMLHLNFQQLIFQLLPYLFCIFQ